jgi:peptidoglycan/LPS O-acetylase OafA/YrhL
MASTEHTATIERLQGHTNRSIVIPAIILTLFLDFFGKTINPLAYISLDERLINPYITLLSALLFINESWTEVIVFSNTPFWSLSYEVQYYIFLAFYGI